MQVILARRLLFPGPCLYEIRVGVELVAFDFQISFWLSRKKIDLELSSFGSIKFLVRIGFSDELFNVIIAFVASFRELPEHLVG